MIKLRRIKGAVAVALATLITLQPLGVGRSVILAAGEQTKDQVATQADSFPASYDLRNVNGKSYVTSVKLQNPWGTCWAFAYIAAAETSILGETDKDATETKLDLSEHHMAWFAKNAINDPSNSQNGEGYHINTSTASASMEGSCAYIGTNVFASGVGVVSEDADSSFAYKGIDGYVVGKKTYKVYASVEECLEAGDIPYYYSKEDDWTIDESLRFYQTYELEESFILPAVKAIDNGDGTFSLNEVGVNAIKEQLLNKRGVSVRFCADAYLPEQDKSKDATRFINDNWAHFTWDNSVSTNHAVTIVGYDDNYSKENFTISNPAKFDDEGRPIYKLNGMTLDINEEGLPCYAITYSDGTQGVRTLAKDSILIETYTEDSVVKYRLKTSELNYSDSGILCLIEDGKQEDITSTSLCEIAHESKTYVPEGDGAWIVKNSWGADSSEFPDKDDIFGIDGYFYLSYYDRSIKCPESFDFITSEEDKDFDYTYIDQYDFMPVEKPSAIISDDKMATANVFASDEPVEVTAVSCNTYAMNTNVKYEIYLLNDNYQNPTDGTLVATEEAKYKYGGFHRIKLSNKVNVGAGQSYSVVVTQYAEKNDRVYYYMSTSISRGEKFNPNFYCKAVVNKGESFVMNFDTGNENEWMDLVDAKEDIFSLFGVVEGVFELDNFGIKAYANPAQDDSGLNDNSNSGNSNEGNNGAGAQAGADGVSQSAAGGSPLTADVYSREYVLMLIMLMSSSAVGMIGVVARRNRRGNLWGK